MDRHEGGGVPEGLTSGRVRAAGVEVRWYRRHGDGPTIVLLHGGGAHSAWWFDAVAHFGDRDVVMLDLSGHGDSARRGAYTLSGWAEEVRAALGALDVDDAIVVCHSMSGRIGVLIAAAEDTPARALILVDTVIPTHSGEPVPPVQPSRHYGTREAAVERFRFIPPAPEIEEPVRRRMGETSVRESPEGWTWKFDPRVFAMPDADAVNAAIPSIRCPIGLVVAGDSPVSTVGMGDRIATMAGRRVEVRLVDGVGHHLMLERPALVAETILEVVAALAEG